MKTPENYTKQLKDKNLSEEVIAHVLYSINKRAKNYRDKKKEYANSTYLYSIQNYTHYDEKMNEAYKMKHDILSIYEPIEIHKTTYHNTYKKRIYETDPNYDKISRKNVIKIEYDFQRNQHYKMCHISNKETKFFLYFEISDFKFHMPIREIELEKFRHLLIKKLENNFNTKGRHSTELLSPQFCKKVFLLLQEQTTNSTI